jgi:hypothetical protein
LDELGLAVGDGIGADSVRLASAGFNVHYMDYEESITSRWPMKILKFNNANKIQIQIWLF